MKAPSAFLEFLLPAIRSEAEPRSAAIPAPRRAGMDLSSFQNVGAHTRKLAGLCTDRHEETRNSLEFLRLECAPSPRLASGESHPAGGGSQMGSSTWN